MEEGSYVDAVLEDCRDKMAKALDHARSELSTIRTGRAAPVLVEKLRVDYYGSEVPLQQLAGIQVPEAKLLVITPYDKSSLKAIEKAIQNSDLGVNPNNDGTVIRLSFPPLTEERRKAMVESGSCQGRGRSGGGPQRQAGGAQGFGGIREGRRHLHRRVGTGRKGVGAGHARVRGRHRSSASSQRGRATCRLNQARTGDETFRR